MKRKIVFLCYSRYVVMVAYFLKKIYFKDDECILMISDEIANENGIIGKIENSGLWNMTVCLPEKEQQISDIYEWIDKYLENNVIDIFFVAHIKRCAAHYFVNMLPEKTQINIFDEGIISLDLEEGYRRVTRNGLPKGWMEFDFSRIEEMYTFFPDITKSVGTASIKKIELNRLNKEQFQSIVHELNLMFGYVYRKIEKPIIVIDADIAKQGFVTPSYEKHCIENMFSCIDANKCVIKVKPSESKEKLNQKYGKYNIEYLDGGLVPFEVIYMNCILNNDLPECIVALPTTLIWNLILINEAFEINNQCIISIASLMAHFYIRKQDEEVQFNKINNYQKCFGNKYKVKMPDTWDDFFQEFGKNRYDERKEYQWLVGEYKYQNERRDSIASISTRKTDFLISWIRLNRKEVYISDYFKQKKISEIVCYGIGKIGKMVLEEFEQRGINVLGLLRTEQADVNTIMNIPIIRPEQFNEKIRDRNIPIVILAVGYEQEIESNMRNNQIVNPILHISKIIESKSVENEKRKIDE